MSNLRASFPWLAVTFGLLFWTNPCSGTFGAENPFTAEQCRLAWDHAQRLTRKQPPDTHFARRLQAEALLCTGLQDDPEALDAAQ
jgi:hypothetical protein